MEYPKDFERPVAKAMSDEEINSLLQDGIKSKADAISHGDTLIQFADDGYIEIWKFRATSKRGNGVN